MLARNLDLATYVQFLIIALDRDAPAGEGEQQVATMNILAAPNTTPSGPHSGSSADRDSIKSLGVTGMSQFALSDILTCKSLESLSINEVEFAKAYGECTEDSVGKTISRVDAWSNLETLRVTRAASTFALALAAYPPTSQNIKKLWLLEVIADIPLNLAKLIDVLPGITYSLTTLTFTTSFTGCYQASDLPIDLVVSETSKPYFWMFRLSTPSSCLKNVFLTFECTTHQDTEDLKRQFQRGDWSTLDGRLADPFYEALVEMKMSFRIVWWRKDVEERARQDVRDLISQKIYSEMPLVTRSQKSQFSLQVVFPQV
ncbi:hypothetical protein NLJ89_g8445 [Agrocybe chaxingu]|uniref:Uncharacterized protein n=1 Tax=Agrocybe chaxingu TaxID=84603 RepID=A0A9W8JUN6_9AGAR|nr:hypothetical protein NLJ89_g8445 [Agrocybe chaxingu]